MTDQTPHPPAATPAQVVMIPLEAINAAALTRDRITTDEAAIEELRRSILTHGLRMPIEVCALPEGSPLREGGHRYGLISGFRRLTALRAMHELAQDKTRYAAIPAFIRSPADYVAALTAMVEENAIRAEISPWEQALVAVIARDEEGFETIEAAVEGLYASLGRDRRKRLRAIAHLVDELDGVLTDPQTLSQRQLLRVAAAVSRGYVHVIRHALRESSARDAENQWRVLLPVLVESETSDPVEPEPLMPDAPARRPRRLLYPRRGVHIRREATRDGWCLHITGPMATGGFMDGVMDEIERWCGPA